MAESNAGPETRIGALAAAIDEAGLDAVLVTSDASIAYLTGFWGMQLERLFAVVVTSGGAATIVVPALEEETVGSVPERVARAVYTAASDGLPELRRALDGVRRLGVEEDHLVFARSSALDAAGFELVAAGSLVMALREAKDEEEIERIRRSVGIVEGVVSAALAELAEGDVEAEVNARIANRLRDAGATECHPLVLFGPNAANPHGTPGPRTLARGDVVCADVSAQIDGYWADLTRCASAGEPTEWARAAWSVVAEALAAATDAARAGAAGRDVDAAQRAIVEASPELGACLHGAGHAMGLEIHEPPFLTPRGTAPLAAGAVLTVEPGIYAAGTGGIRIEDVVVVTDGDPVVLTTLPRELLVLPAFAPSAPRAADLEETRT